MSVEPIKPEDVAGANMSRRKIVPLRVKLSLDSDQDPEEINRQIESVMCEIWRIKSYGKCGAYQVCKVSVSKKDMMNTEG